jgi:hypothetical protein
MRRIEASNKSEFDKGGTESQIIENNEEKLRKRELMESGIKREKLFKCSPKLFSLSLFLLPLILLHSAPSLSISILKFSKDFSAMEKFSFFAENRHSH